MPYSIIDSAVDTSHHLGALKAQGKIKKSKK
jgi:hypothetical protein